MGRKSKIEKLPAEVQRKILKERIEGKTLREVEKELKDQGYDINYENIRRWEKKYEGAVKYMILKGGEISEEDLLNSLKFTLQNLNVTYTHLQSVLSRLSSQEMDIDLLERHLRLVAEAMQVNTRAMNAVYKALSIQEILDRRKEKAIEKIEEEGKRRGIDPEFLETIRRELYGI